MSWEALQFYGLYWGVGYVIVAAIALLIAQAMCRPVKSSDMDDHL